MNTKPIIGILGGISSGKSTVAKQLETFGCAVIDADKIAKDLLLATRSN
jgi:dephospho-CoA kinase